MASASHSINCTRQASTVTWHDVQLTPGFTCCLQPVQKSHPSIVLEVLNSLRTYTFSIDFESLPTLTCRWQGSHPEEKKNYIPWFYDHIIGKGPFKTLPVVVVDTTWGHLLWWWLLFLLSRHDEVLPQRGAKKTKPKEQSKCCIKHQTVDSCVLVFHNVVLHKTTNLTSNL